MVGINMEMPKSCEGCKFKGARLCYIAVWLEMHFKEIPKEGRAEWCPLINLSKYEDDLK